MSHHLTMYTKISICLLTSLLLFGFAYVASAATLSTAPATGVYTVGQTFSAQIRVNTQGAAINAAEAMLSFDPQKLSVVSISKGSIFNLWTADPSFSNSAGTISFSGGATPPGYSGGAGTIATVVFRAKASGDTSVKFKSGSVLAADGLGTNVLASMGSAAFTIIAADVPAEPEVIEYVAPANTPSAPVVKSSTHPDPTKWYTNTTAELSWALPSGVTSVRTLLSDSSGSIPTKVYETPIESISISDLEEGVQYFHIQFKNADGWGRVSHYRLAVDTSAPSSFIISLPENADLSSPTQVLNLNVVDEPSGVERYTVQLDGGEPYEYIDETGSSTITIPALDPGYHTLIMEAFDGAGNSLVSTFSFTILAFDKPQFTEYPREINSEVIPVIKGQTRPHSDVTVSVQKVGGDIRQYHVVADESGVFTFIPDTTFTNGVYELIAIAIDQHGAKSDPSDPIRIAVQDPGYMQIGSFIVSVLSVMVPIIALLLLFILLFLYFVRRVRVIKGVVVRETEEALAVLDREFDALATALRSQKEKLEKSRKTKKLTKAEQELINTLEAEMKESRKRVAKEIADVDDIVE